MQFAAMHESGYGTFRTWRDVRLESVMRSRADIGERAATASVSGPLTAIIRPAIQHLE